jgi:hypothetical protein
MTVAILGWIASGLLALALLDQSDRPLSFRDLPFALLMAALLPVVALVIFASRKSASRKSPSLKSNPAFPRATRSQEQTMIPHTPSRRFDRAELEAIRIASREGLLPSGYMGLGRVCFHDLAEQLLASLDEADHLSRTLAVNAAVGL